METLSESRIVYKQETFDPAIVTSMPGGLLAFFAFLQQRDDVEWARFERRDVQPWEALDTFQRNAR